MGSKKRELVNPVKKAVRKQSVTPDELIKFGVKLIEAGVVLGKLDTYSIALSKQDISKIRKIQTTLKPSGRNIIGSKQSQTANRSYQIRHLKYNDERLAITILPKLKKILTGVIDRKPKYTIAERAKMILNLLTEEGYPLSRDITDAIIYNAAITEETLDSFNDGKELFRSDDLAKESLAILFGVSRSTINRTLYKKTKPESLFNFLERKTVKGTNEFLTIVESLAEQAKHISEIKKL